MRNLCIAAAMASVVVPGVASAAPVPASNDVDGKALLLVPLKITKIDDLDFGTMIASGTSGTVALNASTSVRTFAGGVTGVPSAAGHRAYFAGAGTGGQEVVVVVIPPTQLTNSNGDTIDVLALTLDNGGNPIRTIDPVTRAFFVGVGGILNIAANQAEGDYSATFKVTANYE
jgi:hypothetical protein